MNITEIPIPALKVIELYDVIVLHHGFEEYKRDYFFIIESGTKEKVGRFKIKFTHCFDLIYRHKFADKEHPNLIRKSLSDDLILSEVPQNNDGYWWGQGFTSAYPGFYFLPDSQKAKEMSEITGLPMYEVTLETDHYIINFVFHDFRYEFLNDNFSISKKTNIPIKDFKYNK